jgi:hypothetical protein
VNHGCVPAPASFGTKMIISLGIKFGCMHQHFNVDELRLLVVFTWEEATRLAQPGPKICEATEKLHMCAGSRCNVM